MDRRGRRTISITNELQQVEADLAALTLRVAQLRHQAGRNASPPHENEQAIRVGDQVSFKLAGQNTEGIVIGITAHRVRIRQDRTNHIFLRSPRNVVRLTHRLNVGH
jgi:hypothetical protein